MKFLPDLPPKGLLGRFILLQLTAGKFPMQGQGTMGISSGGQNALPVNDNTAGNLNEFHSATIT